MKKKEISLDGNLNFTLDLNSGKIDGLNPGFIQMIEESTNGENIGSIHRDGNLWTIIFQKGEVRTHVVLEKTGFFKPKYNIVEVYNIGSEKVGYGFLSSNETMKKLTLKDAKSIDEAFLYNNNSLTEFITPNVISIKKWFLANNTIITPEKINLPNLRFLEKGSLQNNKPVREYLEEVARRNRETFSKMHTQYKGPKKAVVAKGRKGDPKGKLQSTNNKW